MTLVVRAVVVLLLLAGSSLAEDSKLIEAKRAVAAGNQAYTAGQFLAAARAYENAYELHPLPGMTFSAAQAYRRHYYEDPKPEWLEKAQSLYRRYLAEEPAGGRRAHAVTHLENIERLLAERVNPERPPEAKPAPPPPTEFLISSATPEATASIDGGPPESVPVVRRVTAGKHRVKLSARGFFETEIDALAMEGRLSIVPVDLKARPGSLRVDAPSDSDIWVDGRLVARSPTAALELPAGRHWVSVSARGHRLVSRAVILEGGKEQTLHADPELSDQRRAAYWTLVGAGAFALAGCATAIAAVVSENQADDVRSRLSDGQVLTPADAATANDALDRRDRYRALSIASFGVSAIAGVTGTLLFVFDNPVPQAPTRDTGTLFGVRYRGAF